MNEINLNGPVMLDLSTINDELVPEGWHTVTLEQVTAKLTSQKGLPSLFVMSRITDDDDPDVNRTVIWNLMLSGDGMIFTKQCFSALNMPVKLEYDSYSDLAADMIGREVDVRVKYRTYEGEKQVSVNKWRTPSLELEL